MSLRTRTFQWPWVATLAILCAGLWGTPVMAGDEGGEGETSGADFEPHWPIIEVPHWPIIYTYPDDEQTSGGASEGPSHYDRWAETVYDIDDPNKSTVGDAIPPVIMDEDRVPDGIFDIDPGNPVSEFGTGTGLTLESVPAPGAIGLLMLAGLHRRRRRS